VLRLFTLSFEEEPACSLSEVFESVKPPEIYRFTRRTPTEKRDAQPDFSPWPRVLYNTALIFAVEVTFMSQDYLLKTEPSEYSFADLQRDGETEWDGVSNPVALKNLREMSPGARLVIYETGDRKSAVGTAAVVSVNAANPKNPKVTIKVGKAVGKPISLAEIKANKLFKDSPLVRQGRLSVVPLTKEQYNALAGS
jgi:predicted RNA-binding protein with PUA-like domain